MRVYHGSPFAFADFRAEHIGRGEGAQAFGRGHYLAQSIDVARSYQETAGKTYGSFRRRAVIITSNGTIVRPQSADDAAAKIAQTMKEYDIDPKSRDGRDWLDSQIAACYMSGATHDVHSTRHQVLAFAQTDLQKITACGLVYTVEIPDAAIEAMLDWDAPLSTQPQHVRDACVRLIEAFPGSKRYKDETFLAAPTKHGDQYAASGRLFYQELASRHGSNGATDMLREAEIPGIRYLDGDSRDQGKGTSNFVVFPGGEHLLTITHINGHALTAPAPSVDATHEDAAESAFAPAM